MKNTVSLLYLATFLCTARAHFRIPYPGERDPDNWSTQEQAPCGGDNSVVLPRYEWNPDGSPLEVWARHDDTVGAMYFCPLENCIELADFNITLFETFDITGAGNFCIPAIEIPYDIGTVGTIQVVTTSAGDEYQEYEEFFNCVDIVISDDGPVYNGTQCSNSTDIDIEEYTVDNTRLYNATSIAALDSYYLAQESSTSSALNSSSTSGAAVASTSGASTSGNSSASASNSSSSAGSTANHAPALTSSMDIFSIVLAALALLV